MSREQNDTDPRAETVTPTDVLALFDAIEGPVLTVGDVEGVFDCSVETACRTLRTLEAQGFLACRTSGGKVVWWRIEDGGPVSGVDPDDPFWEFEPGTSGTSDVSERVDEVIYGKESA